MKTRKERFNCEDTNPNFVWDNTKTHKSIEIHQLIENTQVKILTPTPYWPCLNPSEHLIGAIKKKIRSKNGNGW